MFERIRQSIWASAVAPLATASIVVAGTWCFKLADSLCCATWYATCTNGTQFWVCEQTSSNSCWVKAAELAGAGESGRTNFTIGDLVCSCSYTRRTCGATPGACEPAATTHSYCSHTDLIGSQCSGQ